MKNALKIYYLILIGILFLPIFNIIIFSFNSGNIPSLPWHGFTTKWYVTALNNSSIFISLSHSFFVAISASIISTTLGFLSSYYLMFNASKFNILLLIILLIPIGTPFFLTGFFSLLFYNQLSFNLSLLTVIISHIVLLTPLSYGIIRFFLNKLDSNLIEAARNLGASEITIIRSIIIPNLLLAITFSLLLTFVVSWDEFIISWFTSGFNVTFPVRIWQTLKSTYSPEINAFGTISILISFTLLLFTYLLYKRYIKKNQYE